MTPALSQAAAQPREPADGRAARLPPPLSWPGLRLRVGHTQGASVRMNAGHTDAEQLQGKTRQRLNSRCCRVLQGRRVEGSVRRLVRPVKVRQRRACGSLLGQGARCAGLVQLHGDGVRPLTAPVASQRDQRRPAVAPGHDCHHRLAAAGVGWCAGGCDSEVIDARRGAMARPKSSPHSPAAQPHTSALHPTSPPTPPPTPSHLPGQQADVGQQQRGQRPGRPAAALVLRQVALAGGQACRVAPRKAAAQACRGGRG